MISCVNVALKINISEISVSIIMVYNQEDDIAMEPLLAHTVTHYFMENSEHYLCLYYLDKPTVAEHSNESDHQIKFQDTEVLAKTSGYTD
jgi:hypothetical protein